ncbi:CRISPR-associated endonuclease Cas2 [Thermodesulfovibrio sp. 3907-1M]|uniref:CRISPR-associated endoribonuclease Cas2 n=1 Tax=Thermodesulfovibrio autotrophicus TaxID=3118333 RepID=A0AAU8GYR4_9BACT
MKAPYLVCYDIADEKRLARIYKLMKGKGLHLQYSVFYCVLTIHELRNLKDNLKKLIHPKYDDVRIYPLSKDSLVAVLGCGAKIPDGVEVFM